MEKKCIKIISIATILIFVIFAVYKTGINIKQYFEEKKIYREAVAYINCGKIDKAKEMFFRLGDYKDSQNYVEDTLKNLEKGDSFLFGEYEQDGNAENGPEPIEWVVIGRTNTKALLLSKYCIENLPYNSRNEKTTWEKSTIRKWLNSTFINTAFSEKQAEKYLACVINKTQNNSKYNTSSGRETEDKVFLLSEMDFNMYLNAEQKKAKGSEYIIDKGYAKDGYCPYWIRTAGVSQYNAMNVSIDGEINHMGYVVNHSISQQHPDKEGEIMYLGSFGVRPAIWINLA